MTNGSEMTQREENIEILKDTLAICKRGAYQKCQQTVNLKLSRKAMERVVVLLPDEVDEICDSPALEKKLEERKSILAPFRGDCSNMDSFAVALWQLKEYKEYLEYGKPPLVLNFANPVHPGGGVRHGARAQEEDLCRRSTLVCSLESADAQRYYEYNRSLEDYMASDAMIFTPEVEILRDENGNLLDDTAIVSVLTCAAPMIRYGKGHLTESEYRKLLHRRISAMLKCAAWFDYRAVVLGAWGCGAFRNDARVISDIFRKVLKEEVPFSRFDFAVLDRTKDQYNFNEFNRNFAYENFYADEIAKDTIAAVELKEKARRDKMAALDAIKKSEIHLDKVRGCILGGAAGDALGYPVEFMNEAQIYDKFGEDGITDYALDPETGKALISDDTQMTLFTATGCLYGDTRISLRGIGAAPHNYIMWHYEDWLMTQETSFEERQREFAKWESSVRCWHSWLADEPRLYKRRAPGRTCIQAMRCRFGHGSPPCPTKTTVNISKGCGGVMRVAPIGLFYIDPYRDMKMVASEGAEVAALTHGHSLGFMPAAMLAYIINRIVYPHAKLESKPLKGIILEAIDSVREIFAADKNINALVSIINLAIRLAESWEDERECIHEIGEGWVAEEALAIAIFCSLRHQDSFSAGIIAAANHKGDSDSTAAITGNILGALLGYSAIAEKWKTNLELSDVILEVSDDMCHGCVMDEYSSYYDDRWHDKYVEGRMPK